MRLVSAAAGVDVPDRVARAVGELLAQKAEAREHDTTARVSILDSNLHDTLSREVFRPVENRDISTTAERAQRFFESVLLPPDRL